MPDIPASLLSRIDRPVALVGLMGSGKSMLGRKLAKRLGLPFADSDALVEQKAGITITEIFDIAGEAKFREMERRAISAAVGGGPMVLAAGGGAMCNAKTARVLSNNAITVWLQASPKTLLSRIGSTASRPLLAGDDPLGILERLISERTPQYEMAQIHLNTNGMSSTKALNALIASLDRHLPVT